MDFSQILLRSAQLTWRYKHLWVIGFVLNLGGLIGTVFRLLLGTNINQQLFALTESSTPPDFDFESVEAWFQQVDIFTWVGVTVGLLFVASIVVWLVNLWAQGVIIGTTLQAETAEMVSITKSLRQGGRWLARFIALDALVYLPLFLLSLLVLLLILGLMLGSVSLSTSSGSNELFGFVAILGLCLLVLSCLAIPLTLGSTIFRALAFRETAVYGYGVRATVHHVWQRIRQNVGDVIILVVILWGVQVGGSMAINSISSGAYTVGMTSGFLKFGDGTLSLEWIGVVPLLSALLLEALILIPQSLLLAFTMVCWTVGYMALDRSPSQRDEPHDD